MFISRSNENTYFSFYVIRSIIILFTLFILYFVAPTFLVSCAHLSFLALAMLLNRSTPLVPQPLFHLVQLFPRINLLFPCLHSPLIIVSVSSFSYSFRIFYAICCPPSSNIYSLLSYFCTLFRS